MIWMENSYNVEPLNVLIGLVFNVLLGKVSLTNVTLPVEEVSKLKVLLHFKFNIFILFSSPC